MRTIGWLMNVGVALAMSACATTPDVPFSNADFASYHGNGPARIEGQAFLKTQGGDVKTCAGEQVLLAPATAYDEAVVSRFAFSLSVALMWAGPAAHHWRKSICDSRGNFNFSGVPRGEWFVITQVRWAVRSTNIDPGNLNKGEVQGGTLVHKVTLHPGANSVILSMDDLQTSMTQIFGSAGKGL